MATIDCRIIMIEIGRNTGIDNNMGSPVFDWDGSALSNRSLAGDLNQFWLHKFRATFATVCIRSGQADIVTVQGRMGHKDLSSMNRYVKAAGCGPEMQEKFNRIEFP